MVKYFILVFILAFSFNLSGQAFPDRHSTSFTDAWLSCQLAPSPNTDNPSGHWIMYDLGATYRLGTSTIWNYNDPVNLDQGINDFSINISTDGTQWISVGTYSLAMASGSTFYEGETGPHFGDAEARFVLLTALSNHGGSCYGMSELRIDVDGTALPVQLVDFTLDCHPHKVVISWSTASEVNNSHFEIQRSLDGSTWVSLAKINGNGNSTQLTQYSYIDKYPESKAYYRLRQQDQDGREFLHDVEFINCQSSDARLIASPNPFIEKTSIQLNGVNEGMLRYTISDVSGKVWKEEELDYRVGHPIDLNLSDLSDGHYLIFIQRGNEIMREQIIKISK